MPATPDNRACRHREMYARCLVACKKILALGFCGGAYSFFHQLWRLRGRNFNLALPVAALFHTRAEVAMLGALFDDERSAAFRTRLGEALETVRSAVVVPEVLAPALQ